MKRCPWCNYESNEKRCPRCKRKKSDAFIAPIIVACMLILMCYGIMFIAYFFK